MGVGGRSDLWDKYARTKKYAARLCLCHCVSVDIRDRIL